MNYANFADRINSNDTAEVTMTMQDLSPSMDEEDWKPNRLAAAITANEKLLDIKLKHHPKDKMGVIGFSGTAQLFHPPAVIDQKAQCLRESFRKTINEGGTNFTAALELAEKCLFGKAQVSNSSFLSRMLSDFFVEVETNEGKSVLTDKSLKRITMLTDGEHNQGGSPVTVAKRLKNAGVIIDCVGIGGSPADVDEALLKRIASTNPDGSIRYCFIGDQQQLIKKYQTLASHIRPV